jgi:hypothetical protein
LVATGAATVISVGAVNKIVFHVPALASVLEGDKEGKERFLSEILFEHDTLLIIPPIAKYMISFFMVIVF